MKQMRQVAQIEVSSLHYPKADLELQNAAYLQVSIQNDVYVLKRISLN